MYSNLCVGKEIIYIRANKKLGHCQTKHSNARIQSSKFTKPDQAAHMQIQRIKEVGCLWLSHNSHHTDGSHLSRSNAELRRVFESLPVSWPRTARLIYTLSSECFFWCVVYIQAEQFMSLTRLPHSVVLQEMNFEKECQHFFTSPKR